VPVALTVAFYSLWDSISDSIWAWGDPWRKGDEFISRPGLVVETTQNACPYICLPLKHDIGFKSPFENSYESVIEL
jgi:hypothetical protein